MHKILIIDDEKPARDFIAELITFYIPDASVTQMETSEQALACMQTENFDVLFVDICMPGMSGLELLEQVRSMGKQPYTVIISAHCEFDYAVKGIELGVVRYIVKPLYREKIYEAIRLYLSNIKSNPIDLKVPDGIRRIEIHRLLATQTVERGKVEVYTVDAYFPYVAGSLSLLHSLLPSHFRYIRRDCILNFHAIKHYNLKSREVIVNCQNKEITFVISREKMKEFIAWFDPKNIEEDEK